MIIWLASYPKSGNTWLRSLIANYYFSETGDFNFELLEKIDSFPSNKYFRKYLDKLDCPARWKLRLQRHFWREKYFNDLLKRLETNSDIDPTIVEIDKRKYSRMFNGNQKKEVAGRSIEEILLRFATKIKDPRRTKKGSNVVKILKEYLRIE